MSQTGCICIIVDATAIEVSDDGETPVISDEHATAWEALYVPSTHLREDPNQAPTEVAPSTHDAVEGETPSIPETPRFHLPSWKEGSEITHKPSPSQTQLTNILHL